jgi:hypothetical protein
MLRCARDVIPYVCVRLNQLSRYVRENMHGDDIQGPVEHVNAELGHLYQRIWFFVYGYAEGFRNRRVALIVGVPPPMILTTAMNATPGLLLRKLKIAYQMARAVKSHLRESLIGLDDLNTLMDMINSAKTTLHDHKAHVDNARVITASRLAYTG